MLTNEPMTAPCNFIAYYQAIDSCSLGTTEVTYPSGIAVRAGNYLCADESISGADAIVTITGYIVPSGTSGDSPSIRNPIRITRRY